MEQKIKYYEGYEGVSEEEEWKKRRALTILVALTALSFAGFVFFFQYMLMFIGMLSVYFFLVYVVWWNVHKATEAIPKEPKRWPSVTVLIPSYNARSTIVKCVEACKKMRYPKKFEIIVVDDGSIDGSVEILKKINGIKLLLKPKNMGKGAALNYGLKRAKGEIIACIDSDTYPAEDSLQKSVKYFDSENVGSVVTFITVSNPRNLLQKIQQLEYWTSFGFFFKTLASVDSVYVTPGPMALYRKEVMLKLGGYDEKNYTEDMEIALRLQKYGYKIRACHETVVYTETPRTLMRLFKQRVRWYRGGLMNIFKYLEMLFDSNFKDFGQFVLPNTLSAGFISVVFTMWALYSFFFQLPDFFYTLLFELKTGMLSGVGKIYVTNIFTIVNSAWIFASMGLMIWGYFSLIGMELAKQKFSIRHVIPFIFVVSLYQIFLGLAYFVAYVREALNMPYRW